MHGSATHKCGQFTGFSCRAIKMTSTRQPGVNPCPSRGVHPLSGATAAHREHIVPKGTPGDTLLLQPGQAERLGEGWPAGDASREDVCACQQPPVSCPGPQKCCPGIFQHQQCWGTLIRLFGSALQQVRGDCTSVTHKTRGMVGFIQIKLYNPSIWRQQDFEARH